MPTNTRYQQSQSEDKSYPKHGTPVGEIPPLVSQRAESNAKVKYITNKEGSE